MSVKFEKELLKESKIKSHTPRTNLRDRSHQTSTNVELLLDSVTRTILLATQAVIKESLLDKERKEIEKTVECDPEDEKLDKKHLTEKLLTFHTKIFKLLRVEEIGKLVTNLITSYVTTIWETNVNPRVVSHLVFYALKTLPMLQQYFNLVSFYFTTAMATHRFSCKFLSILAGIFSNLAQNVRIILGILRPFWYSISNTPCFRDFVYLVIYRRKLLMNRMRGPNLTK